MVLAQLIAPLFLLCIPAGQSINGPEFCETCFAGFSAKLIMKADISVPLYTTTSGQTVVRVVSIPDTAVVRVKCLNSKNQMNSEIIQLIEVVWYWSQPSPSVSTYSPSTAPSTSSAINRTTSSDIGRSTATPTRFTTTDSLYGSTEEPTAATAVTVEQPTTISTQEVPTNTAATDITTVTVEQPTTITTLEVPTTTDTTDITTVTVEQLTTSTTLEVSTTIATTDITTVTVDQPTTITTLEVPTTTAETEISTVTVDESTDVTTLEVQTSTAVTGITTVTVDQPTTITTLEVPAATTATDISTVNLEQPTTITTLEVPTTTAETEITTVMVDESTDVTTLEVQTSTAVTGITLVTEERSTPVSTLKVFTSTSVDDRTTVTEEHLTPFTTPKVPTTTEVLSTTDVYTGTDGAQTHPSTQASLSMDGLTAFKDLTTAEASTAVQGLTITENLNTDEDISTTIITTSVENLITDSSTDVEKLITVDAPTTAEEVTISKVPSSAEDLSESPAEAHTTAEDTSVTDATTTSTPLNSAEDITTADDLADSTYISTVHKPTTTEGVGHVFRSAQGILETTFAPAIPQILTTVESSQSPSRNADATDKTLTTYEGNSDQSFLGLGFEGPSATSSFIKDSFQVNPRVKRETEPANRLVMYFKENKKSFYLFEIRLEFDVGPFIIPDLKKNIFYSKHASGLRNFETPLNNTYSCSSVEQIMLGSKSEDFFLSISDVKVSTFIQSCVPPKDWVCGTPMPDFGPANQLGNTLALVFGSLLGVSVIVGAVVHIVRKHRSVKCARDSALTKESNTDAPERLTA